MHERVKSLKILAKSLTVKQYYMITFTRITSFLHFVFLCVRSNHIPVSELYPYPCQTSKTERFVEIVNDLQVLPVFSKSPILDVSLSQNILEARSFPDRRQYFLVQIIKTGDTVMLCQHYSVKEISCSIYQLSVWMK